LAAYNPPASEQRSMRTSHKKAGRYVRHNFLTNIKIAAKLQESRQVKAITYAVLSSLVEILPADKALLIRSALPVPIQQLWAEALMTQTTYSLAMQRFQQDIHCHYQAGSEAQLHIIMQTVMPHLMHRFGNTVEKMIIHYLPEEMRLLIGQLASARTDRTRPTEHLSTAELLQVVQQEANLASSEDARQALLGILRAVKKATAPIKDLLLIQLKDDWGQLWAEA
jgi:uncharacterized protein (DUF2267 family)